MIFRNRQKNGFRARLLSVGAVFFALFYFTGVSSPVFGKEEDETESNLPPVSLRGGDMGEVTRLVIDALPENYVLKPGNNRLDIIFPAFEWSFLKDDLLKIALLKNISKAEVKYKEEAVMLSVIYSCNCQGDFYKWKDKKLVLDVFDVNAADNPLKVKDENSQSAEKALIEKMKAKPENPKPTDNPVKKTEPAEAPKSQPEAEKTKPEEKAQSEVEKKAETPEKAEPQKAEAPKTPAEMKTAELQSQLRALFTKAAEQGAVSFSDEAKEKNADIAKAEDVKEKTQAENPKAEPSEKAENAETGEPAPEQTAETAEDTPEVGNLVAKIVQGGILPGAAPANAKRENVSENVSVSAGGMATENYDPLPGANEVNYNSPCLPPATFAVPAVGIEDSFYQKLSDYRGKLMNEFDKPDLEAALKLAQYYVSYGMGDEALQTLQSFDLTDRRGFVVRSMAELLAGRPINPQSVFTPGEGDNPHCEGPHALWKAYFAYKAGNDKLAAEIAAKENVLKAFADLPRPLQTEIGTALALNLIREGNKAGAQSLVDVIAENVGQFDTGVTLVRGLIDASEGNAYRAIESLEAVMRNATGPDTQMAGLALSEIKLATDASLREEDLSALEEVAFLKSAEPDGARALALIAEHHARNGDFNTAFERLKQNNYTEENVRDPVAIKVEALFRRMAVNGEGTDNPNNLNIFWKYNELLPQDPALYYNFAKKLHDLGHDRAVQEIIAYLDQNFPEYGQKQDTGSLAAAAYIRTGEYKKAKAALKNDYPEDTDYALLKAKIYALNEEYAKAYQTLAKFTGAAAENAKARYAASAGLWKEAQSAYENAYTYENDPEKDEISRIAGYMAGNRYPGKASEYKETYKKVFQHTEGQASAPEELLTETGSVTDYFREKGDALLKFLYDGLRFESALVKNDKKNAGAENDKKNSEKTNG